MLLTGAFVGTAVATGVLSGFFWVAERRDTKAPSIIRDITITISSFLVVSSMGIAFREHYTRSIVEWQDSKAGLYSKNICLLRGFYVQNNAH